MKFLLANGSQKLLFNSMLLCNGLDDGLSFYMGSTMWSFPNYIDTTLAIVREDFSEFKNTLFLFGTNDVMKVEKDPLHICVDRYLNKVVELSERLQLPHPLILSPTPSRNPHTSPEWIKNSNIYHPFEDIKARFKEVDTLLQQGCQSRSLDFLSMYELLNLDGSLNPDYSLDDIHFNNAGRLLYLERLDTHLQSQ